jgi:hypothetical protein
MTIITDLHKGGKKITTYLIPGTVVTFKSTLLNLDAGSQESYLDLYNLSGDIILRITLRGGKNKIFCNDYTPKSLQSGWGKVRSADLDVNWQSEGATISVYNFLTESKLPRYQILVNLTTVCYFDSRFPGSVNRMSYSERSSTLPSILSDPLGVVSYAMLELQPEERRAIQSGG